METDAQIDDDNDDLTMDDDQFSIASDISLIPDIASEDLLEMKELGHGGEVACSDATIFRVSLFPRVLTNGISLEVMERTEDESALVGTVLVRNDCYEKCVAVRHTSSDWETYEDTVAQWVETVGGGVMDRFQFRVNLPEKDQWSWRSLLTMTSGTITTARTTVLHAQH